ncbi:MAG: hypothetical protein IJG80_10300 [Selenomonadaceae bacterium]|nr:hypothetical protein [Selenomonadaceae bacterium]
MRAYYIARRRFDTMEKNFYGGIFMGSRRKAIRAGILFIALLIVSGVVLMYRGNDAVFLATQKRTESSRRSR